MAEQDEQGLVIVGSDGTEHEFPVGMDPQKAAAVVREQEATAKSGPLVRSRTGQMYRHPTDPISKDVIDGALSAVNPMNYVDLAKTALSQNPATTAMDTAEGLVKLPFRMAGGLVTDPARTLGGMAGAEAVGAAMPLGFKSGARTLGKGLEKAGTKAEWPMQVAASHQILSGNPGGLAVMAIPPILRKIGRGLQDFGTTDAMLKSEADTMLQRGAPAPQPSIRVTAPARDYYGVAKENAAEAAAAKGGAVAGGPPVGWPANVPWDPAKVVGGIQPVRGGPKVTTLGGDRPSIRVTGKPAADLAGPGIVPVEGVHAAPPVIDPAAQAVRDQTAPFHPTGKAATDLANGTVPTASHAPMPTDTRMDEMVSKFAEGPKPARIPTQEGIPASKSKGPQSGTPGLTRADLEEAGLNPDLNYKDLTAEMVDKIKANRASRHQTKYANAQSDRRFGTTRDDMKSILEQSLLLNMDRLR